MHSCKDVNCILADQIGIIWRHVAGRENSSCRTRCGGMSFRLTRCLGKGLRGFTWYSELVLHTECFECSLSAWSPSLPYLCFPWLQNLEAPQPHPQKGGCPLWNLIRFPFPVSSPLLFFCLVRCPPPLSEVSGGMFHLSENLRAVMWFPFPISSLFWIWLSVVCSWPIWLSVVCCCSLCIRAWHYCMFWWCWMYLLPLVKNRNCLGPLLGIIPWINDVLQTLCTVCWDAFVTDDLPSLVRAPISKYFKEVPGTPSVPAATFRGSLSSFKGSSLIWNGSCAEVFCFAYDALCPFYNSVLGLFLSDNVTFSCALSGMLAHYTSNRFIQRPNLIVLHVSITLVVGSPANSVNMF